MLNCYYRSASACLWCVHTEMKRARGRCLAVLWFCLFPGTPHSDRTKNMILEQVILTENKNWHCEILMRSVLKTFPVVSAQIQTSPYWLKYHRTATWKRACNKYPKLTLKIQLSFSPSRYEILGFSHNLSPDLLLPPPPGVFIHHEPPSSTTTTSSSSPCS